MENRIVKYFNTREEADDFAMGYMLRYYVCKLEIHYTRENHSTNPSQWKVEICRCNENFIKKFIDKI